MPYSMTAFGRFEFESDLARGAWEIRSVNHRYSEVALRLPDDFRVLEGSVREKLQRAVRRGKVDCTLRVESRSRDGGRLKINEAAAREVIAAIRQVNALTGAAAPPAPMEILRWPGVIDAEAVDLDNLRGEVLSYLDDALDSLLDGRRREGDKLAALIRERVAAMRAHVDTLENCVPEIISNIRERHEQRIRDLAPGFDENRIEQECAVLLQRLDVDEELGRLRTHLDEVARVLEQEEPIGRRLDFLMQELNREANTLGSKSAHVDTTGASIELKVLIEQIREQVQNIE